MSRELQIVLAGRDRRRLGELERQLAAAPVGRVQTLVQVNGHMDPLYGAAGNPDIAVVLLSDGWEAELEALGARPAAVRPPAIVIGPSSPVATVRLAMRAGARDYFTWPVPTDDLMAAVTAIAAERDGPSVTEGERIAVIGAKGGMGSSMVACNLAVALAERHGRCLLVDGEFGAADLPFYFDLRPAGGGLKEALARIDELDEMAVEGYLLAHDSGVRLLAPTAHGAGWPDGREAAALERLLELFRTAHPHQVLLLPRWADPMVAGALGGVDRLLLVMQQGVVNLREAKLTLERLLALTPLGRERVVVVVNRHRRGNPVGLDEIARALGVETVHALPNDFERVEQSIESGVPLLEQAPRSAVSRALAQLADELAGGPPRPASLLTGLLNWARA